MSLLDIFIEHLEEWSFKHRSFKNRKYPYIGATGKRYSAIVVFTSSFTGVVIGQNESLFSVGYTSSGW
jgi:hypothetical protein